MLFTLRIIVGLFLLFIESRIVYAGKHLRVLETTASTLSLSPQQQERILQVQSWNIPDPTFHASGFQLKFFYVVDGAITEDDVDFKLYNNFDCSAGTGNEIVLVDRYVVGRMKLNDPEMNADGASIRQVDMTVTFNPNLVKNTPIYTSTGENTAVVKFCLGILIYDSNQVQMNINEQMVTADADTTSRLSFLNITANPKEKASSVSGTATGTGTGTEAITNATTDGNGQLNATETVNVRQDTGTQATQTNVTQSNNVTENNDNSTTTSTATPQTTPNLKMLLAYECNSKGENLTDVKPKSLNEMITICVKPGPGATQHLMDSIDSFVYEKGINTQTAVTKGGTPVKPGNALNCEARSKICSVETYLSDPAMFTTSGKVNANGEAFLFGKGSSGHFAREDATTHFNYSFDVLEYVPPPETDAPSDANTDGEIAIDGTINASETEKEMQKHIDDLEYEIDRMWRLGVIIVSVTGGVGLCLCLCMLGLLAKGASTP